MVGNQYILFNLFIYSLQSCKAHFTISLIKIIELNKAVIILYMLTLKSRVLFDGDYIEVYSEKISFMISLEE